MVWNIILSQKWPPVTADKYKSLFPEPDFDEWYEFSPLHKAVLGFPGYDLESALHTVDVNQVDHEGKKPLYWAAHSANDTALRILLASGADVELSTSAQRLPLSTSCSRECTELLLQAKPNVNAKMRNSLTALHMQAEGEPELERLGCVEALMAAGADIDAKADDGRTSLVTAIEGGNEVIAKYLIEHGADFAICDTWGHNALSWAARGNRHATIELLLRRGQDHLGSLESYKTFIHLVAETADTKALHILASGKLKRRDINIKNKAGLTPTQIGLQRRDVDAEWKVAFMDFLRTIDQSASSIDDVVHWESGQRESSSTMDLDMLEAEDEFEDAVEVQS